jgi:hypothetical protein
MEASQLKSMFEAMESVAKHDLSKVELLIRNANGQLVPATYVVQTMRFSRRVNGEVVRAGENSTEIIFEVEPAESIAARLAASLPPSELEV